MRCPSNCRSTLFLQVLAMSLHLLLLRWHGPWCKRRIPLMSVMVPSRTVSTIAISSATSAPGSGLPGNGTRRR